VDEEDGRTLCRDLDPFHNLRMQLTHLGFERGEYSGIPVPINGNALVVEPSFAFAKAFHGDINDLTMEEERERNPPTKKYKDYKIRNLFYSVKRGMEIAVCETPEGRVKMLVRPKANQMSEMLGTLHASDAWGVDQEQAALQTLGGMIKHRQFRQYLLTGMFLERSKRSHVTYIFRRLRPTVAITATPPGTTDEVEMKILCCLCMHPIAYYAGSWAGAMCPTDDVIAHLALMRRSTFPAILSE
jgi:hypothetical protein